MTLHKISGPDIGAEIQSPMVSLGNDFEGNPFGEVHAVTGDVITGIEDDVASLL